MKVTVHFTPVEVTLPDELRDWTHGQIVDYINENWPDLVDPSKPHIERVATEYD
jgi:hypothetical protein